MSKFFNPLLTNWAYQTAGNAAPKDSSNNDFIKGRYL